MQTALEKNTATKDENLNQAILEAQQKHHQAYRESITSTIHNALDRYYHPGMKLEEVKTIVTNVTNKAEEPELMETVRFLIT